MSEIRNVEAGCPCGSGLGYVQHCGTIHRDGAGFGVTAESLMRARYSAHVLRLAEFVHESWHPDFRPRQIVFDRELEWLGLEIVSTTAGTGLDREGTVEFKARFRRAGVAGLRHEVSSFVRLDGKWVYTSGVDAG